MKIAAYFYKVTLQDVDFTKRLKITRLIGYLLETAGRNAFENHFGIQHLQTENFTQSTRRRDVCYKYMLLRRRR